MKIRRQKKKSAIIMSDILRIYSALFKISFKDELAYFVGVLLSGLLLMLESIIPIFVWLAVYMYSHVNMINGVSLPSTIIYFVVIGALFPIFGWSGIVDVISSGVKSGSIITALIRPMSYFNQLIVGDIATQLPNVIIMTIPVIILVIILAHLSITLITALLFIFYVLIGYLIVIFFGFIIGSLALYLTNIYGIVEAIDQGTYILGGVIIPLVFFPSYIEHLLLLTPFPFMAFIPSATLTGMISTSTSESFILVGLIWIIILGVSAYLLWRRVGAKINAVGI